MQTTALTLSAQEGPFCKWTTLKATAKMIGRAAQKDSDGGTAMKSGAICKDATPISLRT